MANYADIDLANAPKPSLQMPNCQYEGVPVNCGPSGLPLPTHLSLSEQWRWHFHGCFQGVGRRGATRFLWLDRCRFDVDDDGWPDILLACDSTPSLLLMNNHDGTFREEGLFADGAEQRGPEVAGMGVALATTTLTGSWTW